MQKYLHSSLASSLIQAFEIRWDGYCRLNKSMLSTITPQTVMRVEFHPASNMAEHGKWRFYGMPIDNIELV